MPPRAAAIPVNITIHGLDPELATAFRDYAIKSKSSLNTAAKELLRRALGLPTDDEAARIAEWNRVCGSLPDDAADELRASLAEQRKIDWDMWK